MLFFGHPVNQERERQGRPTLSGLWTWGGGLLPRVTLGPDLTLADHPLALGLARVCGHAQGGLADLDGPDLLSGVGPGAGSVLVYWDRLWWPALEGDQEAWVSALVELEDLGGALLAALAAGRIRLLGIDDGFGHSFSLTRNGLRRFWRRGGGLAARIAPRA